MNPNVIRSPLPQAALGCAPALVAFAAAALANAACAPPARALEPSVGGQLSAWHLEARDEGERSYRLGVRYLPELGLLQPFGDYTFLELSGSADAWAESRSGGSDEEIEPYRLMLRFATARTETRLGLQRIDFGPAYLLRSLMWFDRLDPRDPQQLADGAWALRFRYTAQSNANLTLWGLYGNDEPKGLEILPSVEDRPEPGGRLQLPVPAGEVAFTYHRRRVDGPMPFIGEYDEERFALDGRWDVEIGCWFEAVLERRRIEGMPRPYTKYVTVGADYTIEIGNGLHLLAELMAIALSGEAAGWDEDTKVAAWSASYPVGIMDNIRAIGFYSWETERYYQHVSWQRTWDLLALDLSAFRYPAAEEAAMPGRSMPVTGYGGQVTLIFNH